MGKPIGITAFVLLLLSFPVPLLGNFMALFALVLASVAACFGERTWSIVVALLGGIKQFWMSPSWIATMHTIVWKQDNFGIPQANGYTLNGMWFVTLTLVVAPLAICAVRAMQEKTGAVENGDTC